MLLRPLPRILIVRTGSTAPEVRRRHGDYDRWFRDALAEHDLAFDLCDATRSPLPDPEPYAGVLVTGSVKSIPEPEPWMEDLGGFLRGVDGTGVPLLGVCFGCQALAWARGGRVARSPAGFEIGAVDVTLSAAARLDPLFAGLPSPLRVLATHEDRVETMPPDAVALAGNVDTPIQAFRVGERTWGVQFHPEATADILRALILLRSARLEAEARGRGEAEGERTAALLRGLERFDPRPARAVLENFARLCRRGREPGTMM
jgi:GMP synthase (glutamine-hydrolysing)